MMKRALSKLVPMAWRYGLLSLLILYTLFKGIEALVIGNPPTPATPPDSYTTLDPTVRFAWSPGDHVGEFHLQIAENGDFTKPTRSLKTKAPKAHIPNLKPGKRYCWRVLDEPDARVSCFHTSPIQVEF